MDCDIKYILVGSENTLSNLLVHEEVCNQENFNNKGDCKGEVNDFESFETFYVEYKETGK